LPQTDPVRLYAMELFRLCCKAKADPVSYLWDQVREAPTVVQVSCAAAGVALALTAWRKSQEKDPPPTYNPGLPFVGGTVAFLSDPIKMVAAGYHAKGGVFRVNILTKDSASSLALRPRHPSLPLKIKC